MIRLLIICTVLHCCTTAIAKESLVRDVAEFDAAVKDAKPGDEIVLKDGEWRDAELVLRAQGKSEDERTVVRAETPGKVAFTGKSRLRIGGTNLYISGFLWKNPKAEDDVISFRIDSNSHSRLCRLTECVILNDDPQLKDEQKWVSMYGSLNTVDHCRFEGKQNSGALLVVWVGQESNGHQVARNFFGARQKLGQNGGETIRVGTSDVSMNDSGTMCYENYFYHCDGEAEIISNKSCGNSYTRNVFVGCSGALTLRHGNYCVISENVFFGDGRSGTGGVRIIGDRHAVTYNVFDGLMGDDTRAAICLMNAIPKSPLNGYFPVKNVSVRNNVLYRCKESIVVGSRDKDQPKQLIPPDKCTFSENTVITRGKPIFVVKTAPTAFVYDDNSYDGGGLGLAENDGWSQIDASKIDLDEAVNVITERMNRPSDVGPAWMRPGDEYLPEVLKKK
jgi:poly(beta-D-mannuronate) lyase